MKFKIFILLTIFFFINGNSDAQPTTHYRPHLRITEEDGSPDGRPRQLYFDNNTLVDNADGSFTVYPASGSGAIASFVPYVGANANVNLGTYNLTTTGLGTFDDVAIVDAGQISFGATVSILGDSTILPNAPTIIFSANGAVMSIIQNYVGIGSGGFYDPDTTLEVMSTTPQLKLSYDGTNYVTFATQSDGDLTLDSNKVSYDLDFGDGNLATTGTVDCSELFNSVANLAIMPDIQGGVDFFEDGVIGNDANGKLVKIWRTAAEGTSLIELGNAHNKTSYIKGGRSGGSEAFHIEGHGGSGTDSGCGLFLSGGDGAGAGGDGGSVTLAGGSSPTATDGSVVITGTVDWTGITGNIDIASNNFATAGSGRFDSGIGIGISTDDFILNAVTISPNINILTPTTGDNQDLYSIVNHLTAAHEGSEVRGMYNLIEATDGVNTTTAGVKSHIETRNVSDFGTGFWYETYCNSDAGTQIGFYADADYASPTLDYFYAFYAMGGQLTVNSEKWGFYSLDLNNFFGIDDVKTYWGTASDAYIEFDGNSTNLVANAVTGADTMEFTAGDFIFNTGQIGIGKVPTYLLDATGSHLGLRIHRDVNNAGFSVWSDWALDNGASEVTTYGQIRGIIETNTDGSEGGKMSLRTMQGGTVTEAQSWDENGQIEIPAGNFQIDPSGPVGANVIITTIGGGVNHFKATNTATSGVAAGAGFQFFSNDGAALADGDRLGFLTFGGSYDASNTVNAVGITAFAEGAWSSGDTPSGFQFETTTDGSASRTAKWVINNAGHLIGQLDNQKIQLGVTPTDLEIYSDGTNGRIDSAGSIIASASTVTIGAGQETVDYTLTFDGETNDGVLTWMEDEDYFNFADDIRLPDLKVASFGSATLGDVGISWDGDDFLFNLIGASSDNGSPDAIFVLNDNAGGTFLVVNDSDYAVQWWVNSDGETQQNGTMVVANCMATTIQTETLGGGAATFVLTSNVVVLTGDGGGNNVTTITGGLNGQLLTIIFTDGNVTLVDDDGHGANTLDLTGNIVGADDTVVQLARDNVSWYQVSAVSTN